MANPVTIVTGARKGIGRYLAETYAARGHSVYGCSRQAADWEAENYTHFELDVIDERAVKAMCKEIRKRHGRVDNLINNAGVASMNHSLLTPVSTVQKVLNTNVVGTLLFSREAAKIMRQNKFGRIVNFSTVAVPLKLEGEVAYVASKAAVESVTEVMARELAAFEITVNTVGPVPIETDLIRAVPRDKIDQLIKRQAIQRRGRFEDLLNVVDFFLSAESSFVTGQKLYLGGV